MEETLGHPTPIGQSRTTHDTTSARTFCSTVLSISGDGVSNTFFSCLSLQSILGWTGKVSSLFYLTYPHNTPFYPPTILNDSHFFILDHIF